MLPALFSRFASTATSCSTSFFGIPSWDKYLVAAHKMTLQVVDQTTGATACQLTGLSSSATAGSDWTGVILLIVLAVLDIVLVIAGIVAAGFVLFGGIKYVTSQGEPDGVKQAQQTIINALIGLAIALIASALVSFIGDRLG